MRTMTLVAMAVVGLGLGGCTIPQAEYYRGQLMAGIEANLNQTANELEGYLGQNYAARESQTWGKFAADRLELFRGLSADGASPEQLAQAAGGVAQTQVRLARELEAYRANLARPVDTIRQTVEDVKALEAMRLREREVPRNVLRHGLGRAAEAFPAYAGELGSLPEIPNL